MGVWELWAVLQAELGVRKYYKYLCCKEKLMRCIGDGIRRNPRDINYIVERCIEKACIETED